MCLGVICGRVTSCFKQILYVETRKLVIQIRLTTFFFVLVGKLKHKYIKFSPFSNKIKLTYTILFDLE